MSSPLYSQVVLGQHKKIKFYLVMSLAVSSQISFGNEVGHRVGGFTSTDGENRSMAKVNGRVDAPSISKLDAKAGLTLTAGMESVRYADISHNKYMKDNFPTGERVDRNFGIDNDWTIAKRTEFSVGGGLSGDTVTRTKTLRGSFGQWLLGDQLRVGVFGSNSETRRPQDAFLDYDSETVVSRPVIISKNGGVAIKAILNPTTVVNGEYSVVESTERPILRAWSTGVKQFIAPCDCAVHADVARVINLGSLNTEMATGELTGVQAGFALLKSLWQNGHGRVAYRYAREDEYTRAYGDHLLFGSDSYTAAISHEFSKAEVYGGQRPLLLDVAATRYIHNKSGNATTFEMGAGVKF